MTDFIIAGLGEVLFDVLADSEQIGGAPMNFAYHAAALGAAGIPVSTIGDDERGLRALDELGSRGLDTRAISVAEGYATGYVAAKVDQKGVATYTFPEDIAWDHLSLNQYAMEVAAKAHAVCFGTLAQRGQRSRREVHRFLDATGPTALKVYDLNLRQDFFSRDIVLMSLDHADVLKLSDEELPVLSEMFGLGGSDVEKLKALVSDHDLSLAALTRGPHGSLLLTPDEMDDHPGVRAEVNDTIGAGDSFTAATVMGLLKKLPLATINAKANTLAAYVCSKPGAMPPVPSQYKL